MRKTAILTTAVLITCVLAPPSFAEKTTPVKGGLPEVASTVDWLVTAVTDILDFLDELEVTPPVTSLSIDCDAGDSLQAAVDDIADGGAITVSGTCNEKVLIDGRYGVSITGAAGATVDGTGLPPTTGAGTFAGLVTVTSSSDITLSNLTMTNGPDGGLYVASNSGVQLTNSAVRANSFDGMDVFGGSMVNILNSGFDDNGRNGVLAGSSTLYYSGFNTNGGNTTGISLISTDVMIFGGQTFASHNSSTGMVASDGSVIQVEGSASIETNANGVWGLLAVNGSSIEARGNITASDNLQGISLRASTMSSSGPTIVLNDNQFGLLAESSSYYSNENTDVSISGSDYGVLLVDSTLSFDGSYLGVPEFPVSIVNSGFGILARDDSVVKIERPITLTGNDTGVFLHSSMLLLRDVSFSGNTMHDVFAYFGSKLEFEGSSSVGTSSCDPTVLVRGTSC